MNWWENDPVAGGSMDVAKATADWWKNDPVADQPSAPQVSELAQRMDERVAKEAAGGLVPKADSGRYLPFGSFLDEAMAGLDAGLGYVTGGRFGANSYEEAKAYQDARQRYIDKNSSTLDKGLAVAGGVGLSLGLPALNLFKGQTLLPQMGNAAATGAAYGGLYGAGEGEGFDRLGNAGQGAVVGGAVGGALAPVARGVGNAVGYVRDRMAPVSGQIGTYERGAVNRVLEDFTSDGMTPQTYATKSANLGDEGMLADMGEDMLLTTNALGNTPGPQMAEVRNAIGRRQDAAPDRIRNLLDQNAGVPKNIPEHMRGLRERYGKMASPYYKKFEDTVIPMSPRLENILKRVEASGVVAEAEKLANIEGRTLGRVPPTKAAPVGDKFTPKERVELSELQQTLEGVDPSMGQSILDMWKYARGARQYKAESLASWLVAKGGIKNQGKEVSYILGRVKDRPGLVSNSGMNLDDAALAAWQAGFLKGKERPSVQDFLEALDDDLSGLAKVSRGADAAIEDVDLRTAASMEADLANLGIGMNTSERVLRKALGLSPAPAAAKASQPTAVEWDYYKRGIQSLIDKKYPRDTEMGRALTQLDNELRKAVDETINPTNPAAGSWAMGRKLYEAGAQGRQGVETGRKVFRGEGMRPYDLAEDLRNASEYKRAGIKVGARDELNSKMGRAATNFGRKGDATARRALNSEFARENLEQILGPIRADRINRGIDAENMMADTFGEVMSNSSTAKRQAAQRKLPITSERPLADNTPNTFGAVAMTGVRKILNAVTSGAMNERANRIMLDQAKMLTAKGITRDQIAQELLILANKRNLTARQSANVAEALNRLMRGAPVAATEYSLPSPAAP